MTYCQKVGRLKHIRAVPPLKVGRLEPSHGDRFRRQCLPLRNYSLVVIVSVICLQKMNSDVLIKNVGFDQ